MGTTLHTDVHTPSLTSSPETDAASSAGIGTKLRRLRALLARIPFTSRTRKVAVVLTFSSLWFLVILVRSQVSPDPKDLETSSFMGLAASLQQGAVSGRDFLSTYGLVAQLLAWAATMFTTTASALNAYAMIALSFRAAGAVLVAAVLLVYDRISWKQCAIVYLFGALLNLFLEVPDFTAALLLLIAAFAYRTAAATTFQRQIAWATMTGLLCFAGQLVSFELLFYGAFVVVGTLVAGSLLRRNATLLLTIEIFVATLALANIELVVWFKLTASRYGLLFDYQGYALEIIRAYNKSTGLLWELHWARTIVLGMVAVYVVVVCVRALWRSAPEACLLASLLFASLVSLNSALVRSDAAHIARAFSPMIFLFLLIASAEWKSRNGRIVWAALASGLLFAWPATSFGAPADLLKVVRGEVSPKSVIREISRTSKPLELLPASVLGRELRRRQDLPLLVFPRENYIGIGLKRPLFAPVLETEAAATMGLQRYYIDALEKQRPDGLEVLYGPDTADASSADGVQAITRTPRIFEYIHKNFELTAPDEHRDGHYLLRSSSQPRNPVYEDLPFTSPRQSAGSGVLKLGAPSACGIVRVEMKLGFMRNPHLFRPSGVELSFNDGEQNVAKASVRPLEFNEAFATYVSLLTPSTFYKVFGDASIESPAWDHLEYHPAKADLLGSEVNRIEITRLECLNPQMFTSFVDH